MKAVRSQENVTFRPADALHLLAGAPHRLLFFVGASNVLLAMIWWTAWLSAKRWQWLHLPDPPVYAGWVHAIIMQYQMLLSFMFGFLLTVFPRWMNLPALGRTHYLPVGAGMLGGQLLTLIGLLTGTAFLKLGALLTIFGWSIATGLLIQLIYQERSHTWHAVSCACALVCGLFGFGCYCLFLYRQDPRLMLAAIKIGTSLTLLPVYFTVCHRMIPFFAGAALQGYVPRRPMWTLAAFWALAVVHAWLECGHRYRWLWLSDVPMVLLTASLLVLWWPRKHAMPALLRVLFLGFAWLPIAFALYATQSISFAATGKFILARAPAHALFIGFFGSLLVAMVTRVTQGHSGRPLALGRVAGATFIGVQLIAVVRIVSEICSDTLAWYAIAGALWIIVFLPWIGRSTWIYLTPRVDGKPG